MTEAETEEQRRNGATPATVTAIPRTSSPRPEIKQLNVSPAYRSSGCDERVYPTLRLRLCEVQQQQVAREAAGGSTTIQPRQAVTQPRRASTPPPPILQPSSSGYWPEPLPISLQDNDVGGSPSQQELQLGDAEQRRLTFDQWLLCKKKQESLRRRQWRREMQRLKDMKQLRQQMSEQCYADWLHVKRRRRRLELELEAPQLPSIVVEAAARSRSEQSQRSLEQWQRRKRLELERRRKQQLREAEEQRVHDQLRHQLSQLAWQRWLAERAANETLPDPQPAAQTVQPPRGRRTPASPQLQQRVLEQQVASLYLHVPLSTAQRALRRRLDSIDGLPMQRRRN